MDTQTIDKSEVFNKRYLLKRWTKNGFRLDIFDSMVIPPDLSLGIARDYLPYRFYDRRKLIFEDYDFGPSPFYAWDSLESVYALLGFLCVMDGDTDSEYFKDYTQQQLDWRDSTRCEELSFIVYAWEERRYNR